MRISEILDLKGHRVETTWPSRSVGDIPKLFMNRKIASVVVIDAGGRPLGIVTDRSLIRALAERGMDLTDLVAKDIMELPPPSCAATDSVAHVLDVMTETRVRHMLVMDHGKMLGIVSIGDIVKHRLRDAEMETRVLRDAVMTWRRL